MNARGGFSASPSAYRLGKKTPSPNLLGQGNDEDMNARGGFSTGPSAYCLGEKTSSSQPLRLRG
jgi:hypothetical protein